LQREKLKLEREIKELYVDLHAARNLTREVQGKLAEEERKHERLKQEISRLEELGGRDAQEIARLNGYLDRVREEHENRKELVRVRMGVDDAGR
jgi:septal ring factor EnvC (AmiA/AmiB activator)